MNLFEILSEKYVLPPKPKLFESFAGIGCQRMAFDRLGIDYESVGISEIDKYAIQSYMAIHGDTPNYGDITKINGYQLPTIDVFTYSFPCTDLSKAGKQKGLSQTRSGLVYEVLRILHELKDLHNLPKVLIMENVVDLVQTKFIREFNEIQLELESLGYSNFVETMNAKEYGVAQNRDRVFMVSILGDYYYEFPKKIKLEKRLKDYLESEVDEKYYLSDKAIQGMKNTTFQSSSEESRVQDLNGISRTLCARDYKDPACVAEPTICDFRYDEGFRSREEDDISPTLPAAHLGTSSMSGQPFVVINEATEQGYAEAYEGDSINLAQPNSKTRRGRVGKQVSQTLTTLNQIAVVEKARSNIKESDKYCKFCGKKMNRKRFNGRLEDFSIFAKRPYCDRNCMKKSYVNIGITNKSYETSHSTARKINELFIGSDSCSVCGSKNNVDVHHIDGNWHNNSVENLTTLCRSCHIKTHRSKPKEISGMRIRKLTPMETWRLMGIDDECFHKASEVNSNSQLYKQAGNGIVVDVFAAILSQMKGNP